MIKKLIVMTAATITIDFITRVVIMTIWMIIILIQMAVVGGF